MAFSTCRLNVGFGSQASRFLCPAWSEPFTRTRCPRARSPSTSSRFQWPRWLQRPRRLLPEMVSSCSTPSLVFTVKLSALIITCIVLATLYPSNLRTPQYNLLHQSGFFGPVLRHSSYSQQPFFGKISSAKLCPNCLFLPEAAVFAQNMIKLAPYYAENGG